VVVNIAEWKFILFFIGILSFFAGMIYLGMPSEYQLLSGFDLGAIIIQLVGLGSACVIATGIPCAVALVIAGLFDITWLIISFDIIKLFIIMPMLIGFIWLLITRIGRGSG